jgi:hypothetical protein
MIDDDTSPDAPRALELAVHLNNLLRAYAEAGRDDGDALRMLLRLQEDLCRALCGLAAEAAHAGRHDGHETRFWLGRSRVADQLLFLIEAVFLLIVHRAEEVAESSYGFIDASLGENLLGTAREVLLRHDDYGSFVADALRGAEEAVGLDRFVAELRSLPEPRDEFRGEIEGLHAEIGRLRGELAAAEARLGRLRDRAHASRPTGSAREVVRRVRAAVARKYHPDGVTGDPLARLVRQEVFKEMQQVLEDIEAGIDRE